MIPLPTIALSVRQPWAWAIIHAGKDIENRSESSVRAGQMIKHITRRIAIHAAKGMTIYEYQDGREFMQTIGVRCPKPGVLERGGIIGSVLLVGVVSHHDSPWFFGPRGLVLANPVACEFTGATGELGMFQWASNGKGPEPASKWMRSKPVSDNSERLL